jgi:Flp pilus assembly protein TadB
MGFISKIIFFISVVGALIGYVFVAKMYSTIWGEFVPMFILCVVTFVMGVGIVISAFLANKEQPRK